MEEVIQSIVAVGGFGYLNYQIIARVRDIDFGDEWDKKFLLLFLSSLDYPRCKMKCNKKTCSSDILEFPNSV